MAGAINLWSKSSLFCKEKKWDRQIIFHLEYSCLFSDMRCALLDFDLGFRDGLLSSSIDDENLLGKFTASGFWLWNSKYVGGDLVDLGGLAIYHHRLDARMNGPPDLRLVEAPVGALGHSPQSRVGVGVSKSKVGKWFSGESMA